VSLDSPPAPVAQRTVAYPAVQTSKAPADAVTLLLIYLFFLILIPSRLVLPGLGAAGPPAKVFALGLFAIWCICRAMPGWSTSERQIAHIPAAFWIAVAIIGWATAWFHGVPPIEGRAADRYILAALGFGGVALFVMDGVRTRERLDRLLLGACWLSAVMSLVGVAQFVSGTDVSQWIQIPGLVNNDDAVGLVARGVAADGSALNRVAGTAQHYIEFTAILSLLFPIGLHYVLHTPRGRQRKWRIAMFALMCLGIPLGISRSGIVGVMVASVFVLMVWRGSAVFKFLGVGLVGLAVFRTAFRGVIGTITSLFTTWGEDTSISARTEDYSVVSRFFHQAPIFGRGAGTFLPRRYITLDNQYLGTAVESGIVGLIALAAIFLSIVLIGRHLRRYGTNAETRHLGQAFVACGMVVIVLSGTFDSLAFPTFAGLTFLLLGAVGALWRLNLVQGTTSPALVSDPGVLRPQRRMNWWLPSFARRPAPPA
jgi:O-antigen ligase